MDSHLYPKWLLELLMENNLPWDEGLQIEPLEFAKHFSVHDSSLLKISMEPAWDCDTILSIQWDTYWNPKYYKYPGSSVMNWPFLMIRIENCSKLEMENFRNIGGIQRSLAGFTVQRDTSYISTFEDHYEAKVRIIHMGKFSVLLYDEFGRLQKLTI